jgi:hypothetical protein
MPSLEQGWQDAMMEEGFSNLVETTTEPTVDSEIDSLIADDGSMEEYQGKVVKKGFPQQEVADLDDSYSSSRRILPGRGSCPGWADAHRYNFQISISMIL